MPTTGNDTRAGETSLVSRAALAGFGCGRPGLDLGFLTLFATRPEAGSAGHAASDLRDGRIVLRLLMDLEFTGEPLDRLVGFCH